MKLYPFQKTLVDKFVDVPHVLIGDEMGLGKTVEAIALDLRRRTTQLNGGRQSDHKTLIVCPLTITSVWERHIAMMWPDARVAVVDPKNRDAFIKQLERPYHYYICHWEGVRLINELQNVKWWHIVGDEIHRIKNRKAQQTVALKKLSAEHRTGCSGTAADNHPQDLWSPLNWLYPRIWRSYWNFTRTYVRVKVHNLGFCLAEGCQKTHKNAYREVVGVAYAKELRQQMEPYYLRRLKTDVAPELPEKTYTTIEVELPPKQRRIYNQMKEEMLAWVGKHEEEPVVANVIVAQLTRLKQFALAFAEVVDVVRKKRGCERCEYDGLSECRGHTVKAVRLMEPSVKLDALMQILEDNPEEKVAVFSESKQVIGLLAIRLTGAKIPHVTLTGNTDQADRPAIVDKFQSGDARVFAGTIHAGGEGITLTAASTVVFLDRMWNPSKNVQAEDRLHRIGQTNTVQVIDIVAKNTVDRGRLQKLKLKWSWLKELLGDKTVEVDFEPANS